MRQRCCPTPQIFTLALTMISFNDGNVFGPVVGLLLGLIPLFKGIRDERLIMGIVGLSLVMILGTLGAVLHGAVGAVVLALPAALFFASLHAAFRQANQWDEPPVFGFSTSETRESRTIVACPHCAVPTWLGASGSMPIRCPSCRTPWTTPGLPQGKSASLMVAPDSAVVKTSSRPAPFMKSRPTPAESVVTLKLVD